MYPSILIAAYHGGLVMMQEWKLFTTAVDVNGFVGLIPNMDNVNDG